MDGWPTDWKTPRWQNHLLWITCMQHNTVQLGGADGLFFLTSSNFFLWVATLQLTWFVKPVRSHQDFNSCTLPFAIWCSASWTANRWKDSTRRAANCSPPMQHSLRKQQQGARCPQKTRDTLVGWGAQNGFALLSLHELFYILKYSYVHGSLCEASAKTFFPRQPILPSRRHTVHVWKQQWLKAPVYLRAEVRQCRRLSKQKPIIKVLNLDIQA